VDRGNPYSPRGYQRDTKRLNTILIFYWLSTLPKSFGFYLKLF
jgi:hypothetical protein